MKTITIEIQTRHENREIQAYQSPVEGLAIHRELKSSSEDPNLFGPLWTITHIRSGLSVLSMEQYLNTKLEAEKLASLLNDFDWTLENPLVEGLSEAVKDARAIVIEEGIPQEDSDAPERSQRFVIRQSDDTSGYFVLRLDTGDVIDTFTHRGEAAQAARDLNAQESI